MKIYYKELWAFWIFKRYSFYVEDEFQGVTEFIVESMASPFCKSNNITIKLSSIVDDTFIEKYSSTSPTISSWNEFDWSTSSDELNLSEFSREIMEHPIQESCDKDISINEVMSNILDKFIDEHK